MRALVVDDIAKSAHLLKKGLEAEFYAVDIMLNEQQAISAAETGDYDVIILNSFTKAIFTDEVISTLRNNGVRASIICISDVDDVDRKINLLAAGCDDVIIKPYNFEELVARMRAILRRMGIGEESKLKVGKLKLDIAAHDVNYDGETVKLRSREFDLLAYLMKNAGRVVTRNMVLENVWDINADSFSNTVEVHITHLRRKLGNGGGMIKTVRGVGYKLVRDES